MKRRAAVPARQHIHVCLAGAIDALRRAGEASGLRSQGLQGAFITIDARLPTALADPTRRACRYGNNDFGLVGAWLTGSAASRRVLEVLVASVAGVSVPGRRGSARGRHRGRCGAAGDEDRRPARRQQPRGAQSVELCAREGIVEDAKVAHRALKMGGGAK